MIEGLAQIAEEKPLSELVEVMLDKTGYIAGDEAIINTVAGADSKLFVSRTYFKDNHLTNPDGGWVRDQSACIYAPEAKVGVYNCTFNSNGNKNAGKVCASIRATNYIVANSTFWLELSSDYGMIMNGATKDHQATLVNSILYNSITTNAAATVVGALAKKETYNYLDCGYNLMHAPAFPDYLSVIAGNETSDLAFGVNPGDYLDDSNKCSAWDGTGMKEGFVKCNIFQLETLIKANTSLGADFWNWLATTKTAEGYKLSEVDVRGVQRSDLNALWPGSYQN